MRARPRRQAGEIPENQAPGTECRLLPSGPLLITQELLHVAAIGTTEQQIIACIRSEIRTNPTKDALHRQRESGYLRSELESAHDHIYFLQHLTGIANRAILFVLGDAFAEQGIHEPHRRIVAKLLFEIE